MFGNDLDLIEAKLVALKQQVATPGTYVTQQLSREAIEKIVDERIKAYQAPIAPIDNKLQQFDVLFQKALPQKDFNEFSKYVQSGSPGFYALVAGDKLYPVIQLLWEILRDNQGV